MAKMSAAYYFKTYVLAQVVVLGLEFNAQYHNTYWAWLLTLVILASWEV
jgi:hypothetical protein